jgi:amino acid transporter
VRVASEHVGDWLAAWVTIGGALSCVGLLNTLLCTSARVAVSAAKLRVLPNAFARVHGVSRAIPRS